MIKISKTNDSTSCQACTETSTKEGSHDLYTVSFGYDGSNRIDSARFCSVCLADLGEKIKSVLKTEYDVTSPVLLLLRKLILCHPDEGSFEIEPEKKDEVKFWLREHGYECEPSENGKRIHIEYWKKNNPGIKELIKKDPSITTEKAVGSSTNEDPCFACRHRAEFEAGTTYALNRCPYCKRNEFALRET